MKSRVIVPASYPARPRGVPAPGTLEAVYENEQVTLVMESGDIAILSRESWNALVRGVEPRKKEDRT